MRATTRLRQLLSSGKPLFVPGCYDALSARILETVGFPLLYMTGYGTSLALLGLPDAGLATMTVATTLTNLPEAPADQVPLLQMMPEGEVVFDTANGMMRSARLRIDKELTGHQGEGSSYRFQSTYTEEFVNSK